jgi:hypothetical protein
MYFMNAKINASGAQNGLNSLHPKEVGFRIQLPLRSGTWRGRLRQAYEHWKVLRVLALTSLKHVYVGHNTMRTVQVEAERIGIDLRQRYPLGDHGMLVSAPLTRSQAVLLRDHLRAWQAEPYAELSAAMVGTEVGLVSDAAESLARVIDKSPENADLHILFQISAADCPTREVQRILKAADDHADQLLCLDVHGEPTA